MPRTGIQTPTSARTSDDLPEPLGPMTPTPLPASTAKLTSCTMTRWSPGGTMLTASTDSRFDGALQQGLRIRRRYLLQQLG